MKPVYYKGLPVDELKSLNFEQDVCLEKGKIIRDKGMIKDCYVCVRPGNKQLVPKVYLKHKEDRVISNNYGHGGIGWSTLWGSVKKSIDYAEKHFGSLQSKKIAVIGAGANGCATVLKLVERGVDPKMIEVFCDNMTDTTSHRSGAILSTASIIDPINPEYERTYEEINVDSFLEWEKIYKGKVFPKLREGVTPVKGYFGAEKEWGTIETDSGLDIFVAKGIIPPPELVYVKFKNRYNLMRKYNTYYFNTYKLMRGFYDMIQNDLKIKINFGTLKSFEEISPEFKLVFNCAGVENNNNLQKDDDILPIGGHIITLKHQDMSQFDYIIYTHYIYEEDKGKVSYADAPLFYFMLKTDEVSFGGLLGGSLMNNYTGGNEEIDEKEYKGVMRRTFEIFGENPRKFIKLNPKF